MNENYTLDKANEYIKNNSINKKYYPEINFAAPIGWINDPNGVSLYNDELHLFYQHYPYESVWGPMHWGHAKSKDGLNWEHLPVAITPDKDYDKDGCFSGSAIEKDGVLYLEKLIMTHVKIKILHSLRMESTLRSMSIIR